MTSFRKSGVILQTKIAGFVILMGALVVLFQNCGEMDAASNRDLLSTGSCEEGEVDCQSDKIKINLASVNCSSSANDIKSFTLVKDCNYLASLELDANLTLETSADFRPKIKSISGSCSGKNDPSWDNVNFLNYDDVVVAEDESNTYISSSGFNYSNENFDKRSGCDWLVTFYLRKASLKEGEEDDFTLVKKEITLIAPVENLFCQPNSADSNGCSQPANGSARRLCNASGSAYGTCQITCNSGYQAQGNTCVPNQVCVPNSVTANGCTQPINGRSVKTCNAGGTAYSTCAVSCLGSYYKNSNTSCAPCANGRYSTTYNTLSSNQCAGACTNTPTNSDAFNFTSPGASPTTCSAQVTSCLPKFYAQNNACVGCTAGNYCNGATPSLQIACPVGSFCLAASAAPTACGLGQYQDQTKQATCKTCTNKPENATAVTYASSSGLSSNNCPIASVTACASGYSPSGKVCVSTQLCTPNSTSASGCHILMGHQTRKTCSADGQSFGLCQIANGTQLLGGVIDHNCHQNATSTQACLIIKDPVTQFNSPLPGPYKVGDMTKLQILKVAMPSSRLLKDSEYIRIRATTKLPDPVNSNNWINVRESNENTLMSSYNIKYENDNEHLSTAVLDAHGNDTKSSELVKYSKVSTFYWLKYFKTLMTSMGVDYVVGRCDLFVYAYDPSNSMRSQGSYFPANSRVQGRPSCYQGVIRLGINQFVPTSYELKAQNPATFRDVSMDPTVLIHELGHAQFEGLNVNAMHAQGGNRCTTKAGCIRAINEGQADFLSMILFEKSPVHAVAFNNDLNGTGSKFPDGTYARNPLQTKNRSAQEFFNITNGTIHTMGGLYSSILWELYNDSRVDKAAVVRIFTSHIRRLSTGSTFIDSKNRMIDTAIAAGYPQYEQIIIEKFNRGL